MKVREDHEKKLQVVEESMQNVPELFHRQLHFSFSICMEEAYNSVGFLMSCLNHSD